MQADSPQPHFSKFGNAELAEKIRCGPGRDSDGLTFTPGCQTSSPARGKDYGEPDPRRAAPGRALRRAGGAPSPRAPAAPRPSLPPEGRPRPRRESSLWSSRTGSPQPRLSTRPSTSCASSGRCLGSGQCLLLLAACGAAARPADEATGGPGRKPDTAWDRCRRSAGQSPSLFREKARRDPAAAGPVSRRRAPVRGSPVRGSPVVAPGGGRGAFGAGVQGLIERL